MRERAQARKKGATGIFFGREMAQVVVARYIVGDRDRDTGRES